MAGFRKVESKRLYESVVEQILELVGSGELRPGERLPTERDLEATMGVSRGVLREAFRVLEARGLILSRPGGGRYLRRLPDYAETLRQSPDLLLEQMAVLDFWVVREALETKAAELAASKATAEQVRAVQLAAKRVIDAELGSAERAEADLEFHRSVASASGNHLLCKLITNHLRLFDQARMRVVSKLQGGAPNLYQPEDNLEIADAIAGREPQRAAMLMARHLDVTRTKYVKPLFSERE